MSRIEFIKTVAAAWLPLWLVQAHISLLGVLVNMPALLHG